MGRTGSVPPESQAPEVGPDLVVSPPRDGRKGGSMSTSRSTWMMLSLPVVLLLISLGVRSGHAEEKTPWQLEARVPASTLAYIAINDVGSLSERIGNTALGKMMQEPEMQEFLKPITDYFTAMMDEAAAAGPGQGGPVPPVVMELFKQLQGLKGQVGFALLDVSAETGKPSLVASLDFGEAVGDFITFLNRVRKEVDPAGEHIKSSERDGRTWWSIDEGNMPVTATTFGSTFVIGTDAPTVQAAIAAPGAQSLATSSAYTKTLARMGSHDPSLMIYGNVARALNRFGSQMGGQAGGMVKLLGIDAIQSAAYGLAFVGDGFRDSMVVYAPNATHGIFSLIRGRPYTGEAVPFVPKDAVYYSEGAIDTEGLVSNIRKFAAEIDPGAEQELAQGLDHLRQALGVDVEKDVVAQLEGSMASYVSMPMTGGLFPEFVFMMKMKDAAVAQQNMERLANGIAGMVNEGGHAICSVESRTYREKPLYLFHLQAARGSNVIPFTPTWSFMGDWMMVSLVPHTMKELVLRSSMTGENLSASVEFQRLVKHKPGHASFVTYYDTAAIMGLLYDTAVPVLQTALKPNMLPREMPPLDFSKLPAARTMKPYMHSMAAFTTMDDEGLAVSVQGPFPMIFGQIALMAGMWTATMGLQRSSMRSRPMVPRIDEDTQNRRNVLLLHSRTLNRAIKAFTKTHGRLPKNLAELTSTAGGMTPALRYVPKDAWNRNYVYRLESSGYRIFSTGPDGIADTGDDVTLGPEDTIKVR